MWLLWLFLGMAVVGVKYYTALGKRSLDRRLDKVRGDLEGSRTRLREQRDQQNGATMEEDLMVTRVQYMNEQIEDIQLRLSGKDEQSRLAEQEEVAVLPAFIRY